MEVMYFFVRNLYSYIDVIGSWQLTHCNRPCTVVPAFNIVAELRRRRRSKILTVYTASTYVLVPRLYRTIHQCHLLILKYKKTQLFTSIYLCQTDKTKPKFGDKKPNHQNVKF